MRIAAKICGITTPDALFAATRGGAAFIGLVFHGASPRNLSLTQGASLRAQVPSGVRAVALVVDPDDNLIGQINETVAPDLFQLHGSESTARVAEIGQRTKRPVIKAIGVARREDLNSAVTYQVVADYLLFDAKVPQGGLPGGTGKSFDWRLLAGHAFTKPWFLSGGLNSKNIAEAVRESGTGMVDVSSGVESSRGVKDPALIRAFLDSLQTL